MTKTVKVTEFIRIFKPRTEKAVKAISLLTHGVRYKPTPEETTGAFDALKSAVNDLAEVYGILPSSKEPENAEDPGFGEGIPSETMVGASRIDAKITSIKNSPFAHEDVHANVWSIPDAQLTAYMTHMLARVCGRFDEPEAQPKNYKPKEE